MTDIEAALADEFDAEHLAVYADYLQGLGDPRGELIALDLDGRADGRDELLARWLGDTLAEAIGPAIEVGFVTDLDIDAGTPLDAILASPAGPFIRGATIHGSGELVATAIGKLAVREHAWLERLAVQATSPCALDLDLARAMPALAELEVWGRRALGEVAHPRVRALRVTGFQALGSLVGDGPASLPAVVMLDFANDCSLTATDLALRTLPALRRLDLSRNEPGAAPPHYLGGAVDACELLARWPGRDRLTHVRLPSVRTAQQAALVARAIAEMPRLRELEAARAYHAHRHVALPHPLVHPPAFPWPPADVAADLALVIESSVQIPLAPLVIWLESAGPSEAWLQVFDALSQGRRTIARDILEPALAAAPALDGIADARAVLATAGPILIRIANWLP